MRGVVGFQYQRTVAHITNPSLGQRCSIQESPGAALRARCQNEPRGLSELAVLAVRDLKIIMAIGPIGSLGYTTLLNPTN